jgi:hypothetical protein
MAGSVSPATGRHLRRRAGVHGLVCRVWGVPRSSFCLARQAAQDPASARPTGRRGPKPALPDADLPAAIRARPRPTAAHDRTIVTAAPNGMQATDGTQIATVRDGEVRRFATVEDWNAEAPGWHVAKRGTRRAALKATGLAVRAPFGHPGRDAARGVQLRHDHGSGFMAEDARTRIRARGAHDAEPCLCRPAQNQRRH